MRRLHGFTLIEILLVLGIMAVLAALLLPALGGARLKAERIVATANMRQISSAILQYSGDKDGLLPGPLQVGQKAVYKAGDTKQLATVLAPYLVGEEPATNATIRVFLSPAFARAMKSHNNIAKVHPFMMNISPVADGVKIQPFGSDQPGKGADSMRLAAVPSSVWILCDADQKNPGVIGHPWAKDTPRDIIHGRQRLCLCMDGSVRNIDEASLPVK